ncbi:GNAT family N-acetyltransferase [Alicyclobacillus fodiniaquatilis]|uniref:GNAT family N-acetyltransferase n=1 Tax=Alicyclobacillus fodiniaquatilis TaxID=1661150 RepID=A0ABW4JFZ8_9BACL
MDIQLHHDFSLANLDELQQIYLSVGWKRRDIGIIRKILAASTHVTIAMDGQRMVGFGRAISDGVFNAAIYDVVVHPDYQRHGIGKRIVEDLLHRLRDISCVHLIATTGNEHFYRGVGFKKVKTAMARYLSPALDSEYLE